MTDIADHCTRHGIKHFSISSGRLWRDQPIAWISRYMLRLPDDSGPAAWRGQAVEAGLDALLFSQDAEMAVRAMQTEWDNHAQGVVDEDATKEYAALAWFLAQATLAYAGKPVPLQHQSRIELAIPGLAVPLIGFADYVWPDHGSDLKTTWRIPSEPDPNHIEQAAAYSRFHKGLPWDLTYCSAKKWTRYEILPPMMEEAWERVVETCHAINHFLGKVEDAHDALSMFASNYASYHFRPAMIEAIRQAKARRLL